MRTLVVSDLHLGTRLGTDVLRVAAQRAALLDALADCQRLVLLGDLLELRHGPLRQALDAAREPLAQIGAALGPGSEVVVLAGNHDHALLDGWRARADLSPEAAELGAERPVDWLDTDALAAVARLLSPAAVRAAYPGVWLREDVYATHGHYLDLHLTVPTLERLATGVMRRVVALDGAGPGRAEDYETVLA
ncbi:MAG: metallophosphoesterase, partial [Solirubrobacteraceae bacterium]